VAHSSWRTSKRSNLRDFSRCSTPSSSRPIKLACHIDLSSRFYDAPKLATAEEWSSVLHLAHKWDFASLQAVATRELDPLTTAVDKIVLSQQYGVEFWLERAYFDVCTADDWLSDADGLRLGVTTVLKIGRARHELRTPAALKPESSCLNVVRTTFNLADAIVSPTMALDSSSGSKVARLDTSSHNAAHLTPPSASDSDPRSVKVSSHKLSGSSVCPSLTIIQIQEAQEHLKSFIESSFGWNGWDAWRKWEGFADHGTSEEKVLLRQAIAEARTFVVRAQHESLGACEVAPTAEVLLDTMKRALEPFRFRSWLDDCASLINTDPWISKKDTLELTTRIAEERQMLANSRQQQSCYTSMQDPYFTSNEVKDRHRHLEADITSLVGSCPPLHPIW
jgi:hypothetical protein